MTNAKRKPTLSRQGRDYERKINKAVREALLDHQRAGNPVAVWKEGKVVIVPPSRIKDLLPPERRTDRKT